MCLGHLPTARRLLRGLHAALLLGLFACLTVPLCLAQDDGKDKPAAQDKDKKDQKDDKKDQKDQKDDKKDQKDDKKDQKDDKKEPEKPAALLFCTVASEADDKDAVKVAQDYLADKARAAELAALAKKGEPPPFPGAGGPRAVDVKDGMKAKPEALAAAAALPPGSLNDAIAMALLLARKKAEPRGGAEPPPAVAGGYRWVAISERDLPALNLDAAAEKDEKKPERKKDYDAVAEARKKGKAVLHPSRHWLIFSREGAKGVEYFVLVKEPGKDERISEKDLLVVRRIPSDFRDVVLIELRDKGALQAFTKNNAPKGEGAARTFRFLAIVYHNEAVKIVRLEGVIEDGRMTIRGRRADDKEMMALARQLRQAKEEGVQQQDERKQQQQQ